MASVVRICNLALIQVGAQSISDLGEQTREARLCNQIYDYSRDAVLRAYDWNFARKRQALGLLSATYTNWDYVYSYPSDCLVARKLVSPNGSGSSVYYDFDVDTYKTVKKVPFEVFASSDVGSKVIATDIADAELEYTASVTDPNMFDSLFTDALLLRLASDLALPLRADRGLKSDLFRQYQFTLGEAAADNMNEGCEKIDNHNTFTGARN